MKRNFKAFLPNDAFIYDFILSDKYMERKFSVTSLWFIIVEKPTCASSSGL